MTSKNASFLPNQERIKPFPIIGMGGSAGSFEAFEKFFTHMPVSSGMAFVIVMHLDPKHKGNIGEVIQYYTHLPVKEATDGMAVEPDHIYVIPANTDMGIHNGKLLLLTPSLPHGQRVPIDYFLQSLAEDQWNKAVAIIFSGMGSDGETGLRMVKEKLGMAMVQDPDTAQYDSMPRSAIETNLADYVLSPEEMPVKLIQYLTHPLIAEDASDETITEIRNATVIQKILMLVRSHTGHDFTLYKKSTISRRIDRRVAFHQFPDYEHYVNHLREHPHEIEVLFQELLIGVTKFFRDSNAYEALCKFFYPLLDSKPQDEPVRVWIAGCSTGEEAYSVAILIMEYLEEHPGRNLHKVQIFATDLDMHAIDHARAGVYRDNIIADVSPERLANYFVKTEGFYTVKKELREMIIFAQHNLVKDPPFTRLDLLCCRNVMIYLTSELQKKIIPIFHYSLNAGGIYFMGPAETVSGFTDMFTPIESRWKIFKRKAGATMMGKMIDFSFNVTRSSASLIKPEMTDKVYKKRTLAETFNQVILNNYTPSAVLINEKGDIIYINGDTSKYLELPKGEAVMNIFKMAREKLNYVLNNAIHKARLSKTKITLPDIRIIEGKQVRLVDIKIDLLEDTSLHGLILIVFEDKGLVKKASRRTDKSDGRDLITEEMQKELVFTKQQLHTTIEQMETSLEELKSTNEELQSTNEELQSTNEEALTTKEEMQSLNEELMTINSQYHTKAEQLTQVNNDMKNMLDNTEIGTIFLDNNLNILRFTPQIKKLFNVIETDINRPITHIVSNSDYPSIESDIRSVIENLTVKEVEIKTRNQEWYNLRIMPYRTVDNFIHGAVLTINRITRHKMLEQQMKLVLKYIKTHIDAKEEAVLLLDPQLNILHANKQFLQRFQLTEQDTIGKSFDSMVHEEWKTDKLDVLLHEREKTVDTIEFAHDFPGWGKKNLLLTATRYTDEETDETFLIQIVIQISKED